MSILSADQFRHHMWPISYSTMQRFCTRYPLAGIATPPFLLSSMPCVTACLGELSSSPTEKRGWRLQTDRWLILHRFDTSLQLNEWYCWCGYPPSCSNVDTGDIFLAPVTKWEGELKITPVITVIIPQRSGLQFRGKVTALEPSEMSPSYFLWGKFLRQVNLSNIKGDDWHFNSNWFYGGELDERIDITFMFLW